jgi:hypothetical protein
MKFQKFYTEFQKKWSEFHKISEKTEKFQKVKRTEMSPIPKITPYNKNILLYY